MDAKIIIAIDDMTRSELIDLFVATGCIFHHSERTTTLREYVSSEYAAGRISSTDILMAYNGGL